MKVVFTIAVRNPEWYWSKDELRGAGDYRKEWEAINGDKVSKHASSESFEVPFDVKDIKENRQATFNFDFTSEDKTQIISHCLKDLTIVQFIGASDEKAEVIISNALIHQYISARQRQYKYYVYFYIKENARYVKLGQVIWLSEQHRLELESSLNIEYNTD